MKTIRMKMLRALTAAAMLFAFTLQPSPAQAAINSIHITKNYADFTASATTKALTLWQVPGTQRADIWKVVMQVDEVFAGIVDAGPSVTAATISVGKSGSVTKYQAATDVFTGVSVTFPNSVTTTLTNGVEAGGNNIQALLTTTSANTSVLTSGRVHFWIYYTILQQ